MKLIYTSLLFLVALSLNAQKSPCETDAAYHQLDFLIGNWEVFDVKNNKAADTRINRVLNNCMIQEEWNGTNKQNNIPYVLNNLYTYNSSSQQWLQTKIDNNGNNNNYTGKLDEDKIEFLTQPFQYAGDTTAVRRLTLYNLSSEKIRQHGEISKNNGKWRTEYDFDYRRKKGNIDSDDDLMNQYGLWNKYFKANEMDRIAELYSDSARIIGSRLEVKGKDAIKDYWHQLQDNGVSWDQEITSLDINNGTALQTGISKLVYMQKKQKVVSNVRYTLFWKKDSNGVWKIHFYHYTNL